VTGGAYLPEFTVALAPLTTGTTWKTDAGGIFCPNETVPSAFGGFGAFSTSPFTTITEIGTASGATSPAAAPSSPARVDACLRRVTA
jgi:hypothetical protein